MIKTIKGFKDIFGKEADLFGLVQAVTSTVAERHGYSKLILPTLEYSELFSRSVGEGTDIVEKEMYTFLDKGGRSITLRPEMTASVARSYIENHFETLPSPVRFYYFGQCFRYENPQKGRFREFYQFGVEALGDESYLLDVEVIKIAFEILKELGLPTLKVKLNSIGCRECRPRYKDALIEALAPCKESLCDDCKRRLDTNPLRILDCKKEPEQIKKAVPRTIDFLCDKCRSHFESVISTLKRLDMPFEIDNYLVRGLDYYSRTVFEVVSEQLGAQNALLGGGRYDYLVEELGGRKTPGVGFAMGIERIIEVCKNTLASKGEPLFYIAFDSKVIEYAMQIADLLRKTGYKATIDHKGGSFKNQLERSAKRDTDFTLIIGEEEAINNTVQIKNMKTKTQTEVKKDSLSEFLKELTNA